MNVNSKNTSFSYSARAGDDEDSKQLLKVNMTIVQVGGHDICGRCFGLTFRMVKLPEPLAMMGHGERTARLGDNGRAEGYLYLKQINIHWLASVLPCGFGTAHI